MDSSKEDREKQLNERSTKYEWLTSEIAEQYARKASRIREHGGGLREIIKLREELREKCGVTELEATNILDGRLISDYVSKYERMKKNIIIEGKKNADLEADDSTYFDDGWSVWVREYF